MKKLFLLFSIFFSINVYGQISGDDVLDPVFSDNEICIYLKNYSSDNISVVIYNNYDDSSIQINNIYLYVNDNLIDKKYLGNNEIFNEVQFNIDKLFNEFKIVVTINNNDNWEYSFDSESEYRWYDMLLCEFTKIKNTYNKVYFNKRYSLDGKVFYYDRIYIMNGKKYITKIY